MATSQRKQEETQGLEPSTTSSPLARLSIGFDFGFKVNIQLLPTALAIMPSHRLWYLVFLFFFKLWVCLFIYYLFLAVLGLRFCATAFSSCSKWGPLFIVVRRPLTVAASLVAEHRLQTHRLSSCGSRA